MTLDAPVTPPPDSLWGLHVLRGLRARFAALLIGGVLVVSLALYALLVIATAVWVRQELHARTRSFATLVASRVALPLLVEDRGGIREELLRATREPDVLGVAVYRDSATRFADVSVIPGLWEEPPLAAARTSLPVTRGWAPARPNRARVLDVRVPVLREVPPDSSAYAEALALLAADAPPAAREGAAPIGWLRVAVSTARLDAAVASVARIGLLVLMALVALVTLPLMFLLRVLVQPLREASGLAREIAAGRLEQRLPVHSRDELGTLAESLNSMAGALSAARAHAQAEEEILRAATGAMLTIARSAPHSADPPALFAVLAPELRRLTGCEAVALARTLETHGTARFELLESPAAWGEVRAGMPVDPPVARWLAGAPVRPLRRELSADGGPVERALHAAGYRTALIVALGIEDGAAAALVLVARRADAFPPAELDIIAALASHLDSALHASGLRDSLEHAFDELQTARGQLVRSERLRLAGELASGVAHDFNNVLGAILGRAQLLKLRAERGDLSPDELNRSLDVIERAAHDGGDTVARLRQFGQAHDVATPELVDLDTAMREAAEFTRTRWENEAQAAGRRIEVRLDSTPGVWVAGLSSEMREVFTNLILNAVDALPRGGTIDLRTGFENGRAIAWVEDNGIGMGLDVQRRVFDPFFTTKGESGTGLGLSVVYGIVQRQGGDIVLYSEPSVGTRAELTFPLAAPAPVLAIGPVAPVPLSAAPPESALHVMVVDDEAAVRELLVDVVLALGHRVTACDSGERALQLFAPGLYDLLLTDLGMPGITGWQLARHVRDEDSHVTIAFITGWGHDLSPEVVREAGANALVAKPFNIEDIETLIRLASEGRPNRAA